MINPSYIGVAVIGFLHGLEPGHGWPVALVYSMRNKNPLLTGIVSSGLIAMAHFLSSIAVAIAYLLLNAWFDFNFPYLDYLAAGLLLFLAYRMFVEKVEEDGSDRKKSDIVGLWGLVSFAFLLGFGHEEEFALLALVVAGVNALVLMAVYGLSVSLGLIGITLISIKIYSLVESRLRRFERYIPKVSAAILALMAVYIIFW